MTLVAWPYRVLLLATFAATLLGFGWIKGAGHVQAQWDAAVQKHTLQAAAIRERQAQGTVKVVTQYVDRVRVVREKGDTIIKEVPVYVPVQADAACTINRGFVRLHDAAAAGELPEPAGDADAPAAGIALSAVAGTVAANNQTCHPCTAFKLKALRWFSYSNSACSQSPSIEQTCARNSGVKTLRLVNPTKSSKLSVDIAPASACLELSRVGGPPRSAFREFVAQIDAMLCISALMVASSSVVPDLTCPSSPSWPGQAEPA